VSERQRHLPGSLAAALLVNAAAVGLIFVGFQFTDRDLLPVTPRVESVKATVVDAGEFQRLDEAKHLEEEKARQKEQARLLREQEAERQRQAEKEREAEQKKLAEEKRLAEEQRQAEIKRQREQQAEQERLEREATQRKAEEKRKREAAEAEAKKVEAERKAAEARRLKEEEGRRLAEQKRLSELQAAEDAELREAEARRRETGLNALRLRYADSIKARIQRLWREPAGVQSGDRCVVQVTQTPTGYIQDFQVTRCTGNQAFRKSVEDAVRRAEPLPKAPSPDVFEREVRFTFAPE